MGRSFLKELFDHPGQFASALVDGKVVEEDRDNKADHSGEEDVQLLK